jgi:hypothetical protein
MASLVDTAIMINHGVEGSSPSALINKELKIRPFVPWEPTRGHGSFTIWPQSLQTPFNFRSGLVGALLTSTLGTLVRPVTTFPLENCLPLALASSFAFY